MSMNAFESALSVDPFGRGDHLFRPQLRNDRGEMLEVIDLEIYEAGCTICTHTGTGWGVAVLPAE